MPDRDWRLFIQDIIEAVEAIQSHVKGMDLAFFSTDLKSQDAVVRRFILIGEAVRYVPEPILLRYPQVPWREMRDMRNLATHVYWGVKPDVVWDTIQKDLPPLLPELAAILEREKR